MTRKACHYAVLAAILLGVPALCAYLSGESEIWEGVKSLPPHGWLHRGKFVTAWICPDLVEK